MSPRRGRWLAITEWTLFAVGILIHATQVPKGLWGDGAYRFQYLQLLVQSKPSLSSFQYSYVGPMFALPLYLLDVLFKTPTHWFTERYNLLLFTVCVVVLARLWRNEADRAQVRAFALLLIAASMLPFHTILFYGEMFTAVTVAIGLALLPRTRWGWVLVALGCANSPACVVPMGLVALWLAWRDRRLLPLLAVGATAGFVLLENLVRRGDALASDYVGSGTGAAGVLPFTGKPGFSYPLLFGLLALLFSFGRGIAWFVPGLWLSFAKRRVRTAVDGTLVAWLIFTVGLVVVYAKWWSWHGAAYQGPRFMLFAVFPAAWLLAHFIVFRREEKLSPFITLTVLAFSVWVSIACMSFHYFKMERLPQCGMAEGALCTFVVDFSTLFYPWVQALPVSPDEKLHDAFCVLVGLRFAVPLVIEGSARLKERWLRQRALPLKQWGL